MNIQELNTAQLAFDYRNKLARLDYAIRWGECLGYPTPRLSAPAQDLMKYNFSVTEPRGIPIRQAWMSA